MIVIIFMSAILIAVSILSYMIAEKSERIYSYNKGHILRFSVLFCIFQIGVFFSGYLPFELIPISLFAVILSVFSDGFIGLLSLVLFVSYFGVLYPEDPTVFACLLFGGAVGVAAFSEMDLSQNIRARVAAFVSADFISSGVCFIHMNSTEGLIRFLLLAALRCLISGIAVNLVIKLLAERYIARDRDFYDEICDPENEYLMAIENVSKSAYNKALHNAYLSEKIAQAMGYDAKFVKAGAYYLNAQKYEPFSGVKVPIRFKRFLALLWDETKDVSDDKNYDVLMKKEAAVVRFADMYIMTVLYFFKKNGGTIPDYGKLSEVVVKKKIKEGDRLFTLFSLNELNKLKAACKAEKKYYEFLRRQ